MQSYDVSIPQAVSTVATLIMDIQLLNIMMVSIPQAVSTVATELISGMALGVDQVSIPQAVSTVATWTTETLNTR